MEIELEPEVFFFFLDGQVLNGEFTVDTIRANGLDNAEVVKYVIKSLMVLMEEGGEEIDIVKIIKELK